MLVALITSFKILSKTRRLKWTPTRKCSAHAHLLFAYQDSILPHFVSTFFENSEDSNWCECVFYSCVPLVHLSHEISGFNLGREELSKTLKWMFIGEIPLPFEARNVARQLEIEMWLDPLPLLKNLNLKPMSEEKINAPKYAAWCFSSFFHAVKLAYRQDFVEVFGQFGCLAFEWILQ